MSDFLSSPISISFSDLVLVATSVTAIAVSLNWIAKALKKLREPDTRQNERLDAIESRLDNHDKLLDKDYIHFQELDKQTHLTMQALLALLGHDLDGNNINEMQKVKDDIQNYLIHK